MIEYILVLIVVVGVILGVLYQFNQAFRVWADNYFGNYLACLIETGELPALGNTRGIGTCNEVYQSFSITDGRPLAQTSNGAEGGEGDEDVGGSSEESASSGGGGGRSGVAPATVNGEGFGSAGNRFRVGGRGGSSSGEDDGGGGSQVGGGTLTNLSGYEEGKVIRIPVRSRSGIGGGFSVEREKEKRTFAAGALDRGDSPTSKPKLLRIERQPADEGDVGEDTELSFGKLLRWLIMAAIIIAVLVFLGGQVLQASKNME